MTSSDKLDKIYDMVYEIHSNQQVINERISTTQSTCAYHREEINNINERLNTLNNEGLPIRSKDWIGIIVLVITFWGLIFGVIQATKS